MYSYKKTSKFQERLPAFGRLGLRLLISIIIAWIVLLICTKFLFYPHRMQFNSMAPTIPKGRFIIISKLFYKDKLLIGDIVIAKPENRAEVFFARIIARSGDKVFIKNKKVFRNGNEKDESSYILFTDKRSPFPSSFSTRDNFENFSVKENSYFLLGDNRDESLDSRDLGVISEDQILGKIIYY